MRVTFYKSFEKEVRRQSGKILESIKATTRLSKSNNRCTYNNVYDGYGRYAQTQS